MMLVAHDAAENRKTVVVGNGEEDPTTYDQWGCCRYPRWCEIFLPQSWSCDESARKVPGRASRSCRLSNSSGNTNGCIPDPILSFTHHHGLIVGGRKTSSHLALSPLTSSS